MGVSPVVGGATAMEGAVLTSRLEDPVECISSFNYSNNFLFFVHQFVSLCA